MDTRFIGGRLMWEHLGMFMVVYIVGSVAASFLAPVYFKWRKK